MEPDRTKKNQMFYHKETNGTRQNQKESDKTIQEPIEPDYGPKRSLFNKEPNERKNHVEAYRTLK